MAALRDALCGAVADRQRVTLSRADDPAGTSRTGDPHLLFISTTGQECVAFYQVAGRSASGGLPGWRNIPLTAIRSLVVHPAERFMPEASFNRSHSQYARVICG